MSDQRLDLGIPDPPPAEPMSAGRRLTVRNNAALAAGQHPATGAPLVDDGRTCRDCPHAVNYARGAGSYWKCALHRLGTSRSAASDIRVSWPACTRIDQEPRS